MRIWMTIVIIACCVTAFADDKPSIAAFKVESAPRIDGKLSEAAWQKAEKAGPLLRYEPTSGNAMDERTEFAIMYDHRHLYIGVWLYDRQPDRITARKMTRDGDIFSDDNVFMAIDTFLDKRNGYVFALNPNGARYDGITSNNGNLNRNWDGEWLARTNIDHRGWQAEIAIPLNSISFDPRIDTWGFNISRTIKRGTQERGRWSNPSPSISTREMAEAGTITGLEGLQQGFGLQFAPFAVGRYSDLNGDIDWNGDVGGDIRYRLTPNLLASLSINTDFAETEVDRRQLNFSQFPLFFPEKRDFFLEDSGIFEFGPELDRNYGFRSALIPFFSRRIGLNDENEIVPITAAGKISGRVGDYNIGLLDASVDGTQGSENAFAGRISRNIFEQGNIGFIATSGDPNTNRSNTVFGPDFNYRTGHFLGNKIFTANAFALGVDDEFNGTSSAWGASVAYPNDTVHVNLKYLHIDKDFDPALGFVRRDGINGYSGNFSYEPRPENHPYIRKTSYSYITQYYTDLDHSVESVDHIFYPLNIDFNSGDEISFHVTREYEFLDDDLELFNRLTIPSGGYWWTEYELEIETTNKRLFGGEIEYQFGGFYHGSRHIVSADIEILPGKHLEMNAEYAYNYIDIDDEDFTTHLSALKMRCNISPDLTWHQLVQHDSVSKSIGYNSRLQWEYAPGSSLYLVYNQAADANDDSLTSTDRDASIKIGGSLRF